MAGSNDVASERFVLRFNGQGAGGTASSKLSAALRETPGVSILDASPRMLLVAGAGPVVRKLVDKFPGWTLTPETHSPLP